MSSIEEAIKPLTFIAYSDMSATPNIFVDLVNDSGVAKVQPATSGGTAIGVLLDRPLAGAPCRVAHIQGGGKCALLLGTGGVTAGGEIQVGTGGAGIAQTSTNKAFARALETGVAGDIRTVLLEKIHHQ